MANQQKVIHGLSNRAYLRSLLATYRKLCMGFSKNLTIGPSKIPDGGDPPSWILSPKCKKAIPRLHSTLPFGGSPSEYCHNVWYGKTRIIWLLQGWHENISDIYQ